MKVRIGLFLVSMIVAAVGAYSQSPAGSGTVRFFDRGYVSNDVLFCDSLHLSMANVSPPAIGKAYYAWLLHDTGIHHALGEAVVTSGTIGFGYASASQNLVHEHTTFLLSEEVIGFSGTRPTDGTIRFTGSLFDGPGSPDTSNTLTYLRNVVGSFQTPNNLGLFSQMVRQMFKNDNFVQHATLATVQSTAANVKVHTNHSYDFVTGAPDPRIASGSVANNTDPLGYGLRRYADFDASITPAGGIVHHIQRALAQADVSPATTAAGQAALETLHRVFGTDNTSGMAKEFTDKCLEIIGRTYASVGPAQADAIIMKTLAQKMEDSIFVAYRHALDMATMEVTAVGPATGVATAGFPAGFSLEQNFPNPFNPATSIGLRMNERGSVKVSVYDALGRLVEVIAGREMAAGSHSVTWDASGMPSGVYVFRLEVKGERGLMFRATRRGMLLK